MKVQTICQGLRIKVWNTCKIADLKKYFQWIVVNASEREEQNYS